MCEKDIQNDFIDTGGKTPEETNKVSLFEFLSDELEPLIDNSGNLLSEIASDKDKLLQSLNQSVDEFILSPHTKWKSREFYRQIRNLQKIKGQVRDSTIATEIDALIDRLNLASFHYTENPSEPPEESSFYDEESQYWEDLAVAFDDPSYITLQDRQAIEYMKELGSANLENSDYLSDLRYNNPAEFNRYIAKIYDQDELEYWRRIDEQIAKDLPIETDIDDEDDADLAENKIQSDPNFAILDAYRESLLFLDDVPKDQVKVVFWQSDFEKFVGYCSDNSLTTMIQLFDTDLSSLYGYGFNHIRIQQIFDIMSSWAEKTLNSGEEEEQTESADQDYDDILSMFFESDDTEDEDDAEAEDELDDEEDDEEENETDF